MSVVDQRLAALPPKRLAGAEGQALRRQRDELAVAASLERTEVEVAQRAREATAPVSPRPLRAALIGGLAGLAIALVLTLLAHRLDRRIAHPDAAAALYGLPLLGQIPKAAASTTPLPAATGGPVLPPLAAAETDAFRVLRTSISYPDVERRIGSVLVTSAVSGEGKTTVALNLARAYAESGARTLLVEGDLRRPVLSERLAVAAEPGLADVLRAEARLESATRRIALDPGDDSGRGAQLDVVVAGVPASNPQTLLEGKRMSRLLEGLGEHYDMVVVDGAPGLGVSDAAPLMREVGAVLVVSRVGRTQIHESQALRDRWSSCGCGRSGWWPTGSSAPGPALLAARGGSRPGMTPRSRHRRGAPLRREATGSRVRPRSPSERRPAPTRPARSPEGPRRPRGPSATGRGPPGAGGDAAPSDRRPRPRA